MMTLPNILTIFRIFLTPFFIICLFEDFESAHIWALIIFIVASITDAYDGYYARKNNMVTDTGKFLDPLADKILVSSAFISFAVMDLIAFWMVFLIIFRDLFVTALRMFMSKNGRTMVTSNAAKSKTGIQLSLIVLTLIILSLRTIGISFFTDILIFAHEIKFIYYLTMLVTVFTIYTGFSYFRENFKIIKEIIA